MAEDNRLIKGKEIAPEYALYNGDSAEVLKMMPETHTHPLTGMPPKAREVQTRTVPGMKMGTAPGVALNARNVKNKTQPNSATPKTRALVYSADIKARVANR